MDHGQQRARATLRFLLLPVWGLCACQNDARNSVVEKPEPPAMQPVLDAFAMPTASLVPDELLALTQGVAERTDAIDLLQIDQLLIDSVSEGLAQLQQNGRAATEAIQRTGIEVAQQPIEVTGDGYLSITRICNGWAATPAPDLANGTMQLTAGFTEQGLDPVVWGSLFACKYKLGEHTIQIDGIDADPAAIDVRAYIGDAVTIDSFGQFSEPIVIDLAARVLLDGIEQLGRFAFKIDPATRRFETLVPLGTGHVIVAVSLDRTSAVEVRASDGTYQCDVTSRRCSIPGGPTIEAP
jgi:hypothetical protein